jgi:arginyl-tRNA synthetase
VRGEPQASQGEGEERDRVRERVEKLLLEAAQRAVGELDAARGAALARIAVVPSKSPEHGDFATPVALGEGKALGVAPRELAQRIVARVADPDGDIEKLEIAGPGFINVFLSRSRWQDALRRVLREGERYGRSDVGKGERVQIEFVSANPTGPLTIGHGRNAVLGDAIARLLEATGHAVTREYYFNDAGRQMKVLGESLKLRYQQLLEGRTEELLPEGFYGGLYLLETASRLRERVSDGELKDWDVEQFKRAAQDDVFAMIRATLDRLGIRFDVYYNEHSLYDEGHVERTLAALRELGLVYEDDGATWLRAKDMGLERDRVLVKSSSEATYLLPDIAYHVQKFLRGFERVIDVLGPDHLDQFPYVQAALSKLGHPGERLEVAIYQWVNLLQDGEIVKMSKRKASFVTVDDVLDQVGADVFRYFMVERRAETHLDFDLALAKERSDRNPVYKIQYAHARLASIERTGEDAGMRVPDDPDAIPFALLESPAEVELAKLLARYPEIVVHAARAREPQEIARFVLDLATEFHSYVADKQRHRVLSEDRELSLARLGLVRALRIALASGLALLGISAPERM